MTASSDFDRAWSAVADVEGWMTEGQGRVLFEAASTCPPGGRIVEIGSFRGRSTIVLALGADDSVEIVAIDPHAGNDRGPHELEGFADQAEDDHTRFGSNLAAAGVSDRVTHVRKRSDDALGDLTGPIDVLYVDGAHRYAPALADIRNWGAEVADGGVLLVHDSFSSVGVTLAILRELVGSRRFRYVGRSRSLAVYRAEPSRSRWGSAARQLAQLPWFAWNLTKKVLISATVLRGVDWPY